MRPLRSPLTTVLLITLTIGGSLRAETASSDKEKTAFFEKHIRPLFVERCQKCHGNVADAKGGLRLVSREALMKGGDSGPAIDVDDPDHSPLIEAVKHDGLQMPPEGKLPDEQIAYLVNWVKLGAPWPVSPTEQIAGDLSPAEKPQVDIVRTRRDFWSFKPVQDLPPPNPERANWAHTDVDRFILAALEQKRLSPSPAADRRTLIRRATFDLTGLPPTPEEVEAFIGDPSPDAFAALVDRLLASPQYGERWARHWLDVARYADNRGYVFFFEPIDYPWAWTYRDYVVQAFNEDLPYDRFIVEQLAADQLPLGEDKRALAALGFLTVGNRFRSNEQDIIDDRIDVISRGFLGLTVTCARCHDHKYDPIPTRDYYSLYGVLASSAEPVILPEFEKPPEIETYAAFTKEMQVREGKLAAFIGKYYAELAQDSRKRAAEYLMAAHALRKQAILYRKNQEPGDLNAGMAMRWKFYLDDAYKAGDGVFAAWHVLCNLPEAELSDRAPEALSALARNTERRPANRLVIERLVASKVRTLADVAACYAKLLNEVAAQWEETLTKARAAGQAEPNEFAEPEKEELRQVFYGPDAPPNVPLTPGGDLTYIPYRAVELDRKKHLDAIEEWCTKAPGAPPRAMVLEDRPRPYDPRVFIRGNAARPGEVVPRQFLEVLSPAARQPFRNGSGRLELARAIADPANPLTARVMVNRIWLHHFGNGLVRTPGDFGLRSEKPTHPELLDYLATKFMKEGWSIKKLHRAIMLSATYQQSCTERPECREADPENRLLWKMNRRRLDFESMRDAMLSVSARLDKQVGGRPYPSATSMDERRRTLYAFVDRLNLPGVFRSFDFANPDISTSQRFATTVPQQALFMLNNEFVSACAQHLALRGDFQHLTGQERVARLYALLYGRSPDSDELALAVRFLESMPADAAWPRLAQALLLTDEFVFID